MIKRPEHWITGDKIGVFMVQKRDIDETMKRLKFEVAKSEANKLAATKYFLYHLEFISRNTTIFEPDYLEDDEMMVRYLFRLTEGIPA